MKSVKGADRFIDAAFGQIWRLSMSKDGLVVLCLLLQTLNCMVNKERRLQRRLAVHLLQSRIQISAVLRILAEQQFAGFVIAKTRVRRVFQF